MFQTLSMDTGATNTAVSNSRRESLENGSIHAKKFAVHNALEKLRIQMLKRPVPANKAKYESAPRSLSRKKVRVIPSRHSLRENRMTLHQMIKGLSDQSP